VGVKSQSSCWETSKCTGEGGSEEREGGLCEEGTRSDSVSMGMRGEKTTWKASRRMRNSMVTYSQGRKRRREGLNNEGIGTT